MAASENRRSIDHQVTYSVDLSRHEDIATHLRCHWSVNRVLRTTYFDTAQNDLVHRGITFRQRSAIGNNGDIGAPKTEAKIPTNDGLLRVAGAEARRAISEVIGDSSLDPVAVQTKNRRLLLVSGKRVAPQFVVALDVADVEVGSCRQQRLEVEAQLFTALPWTKRVTASRVGRFEAFCHQLELDFGLSPAAVSGYQAIMHGVGHSWDAQTCDVREVC